MIENTTASTRKNPLVFLAAASGPGATVQAIAEQEKAGQAQLLNSDRLPTDIQDRAYFESLGVTFGDPDPKDPMFCTATLPRGWKREADPDHSMWSHLVDEHGRRRAFIFYKAAFYDREAFIRPATVASYLREHVHSGAPIITDDTWATPAAITEACTKAIEQAQVEIDDWTERNNAKYIERYTAERDAYASILALYGTGE